ncbi:juvenile hormone epoxide hydrolase-like [Anoplophora glabripennis]|uniref:juvenile hormone epoxide hydrolase-like n=1 Tax=Anoplophora glabripennis TaxID=217634 RepID=UPI0008753E56|nr:juvenile hormone epoxide hydrolase-like [Anoplophora glabripennis]
MSSLLHRLLLYCLFFASIFNNIPVEVPSACARFSNELIVHPDCILRDKFMNLVQISDLEGGHFAAFEAPEALAGDVYAFVEKVEALRKIDK